MESQTNFQNKPRNTVKATNKQNAIATASNTKLCPVL